MRSQQILVWCRLNLAIPLALLLVGAGLGVQAVRSEIGAGAYTILADNWQRMSPATRHSISATLERDGRISQWDYKTLFEEALHDAGGVVVPTVDYDRQSARERLLAITHDGDAGGQSEPPATGVDAGHTLNRRE